jgi:hypothetical protein
MNAQDVIKALTLILNAKYPVSKVSNKEIKSPERPCFKIKFITGKKNRIAESYNQKTVSLDIIYFAESRYDGYLDLLDKQDELESLFDNPLKVSDKYIDIQEVETNVNEDDYILNTLITIDRAEFTDIESVDDNNQELMEHLEVGE